MRQGHGNERKDERAEFIERIAAPLRRAERLDRFFEKRVMQLVRKEAVALYPFHVDTKPWWKRERVFRVSPITGLAMAAGISAVVALSTIGVARRLTSHVPTTAIASAKPDTLTLVRFVLLEPKASKVEVIGDFNQWTRGATALQHTATPGVWSVSVPLTPGRHEYAFIINGKHWVADPLALRSSDDFGTESSVIRVGTQGPST